MAIHYTAVIGTTDYEFDFVAKTITVEDGVTGASATDLKKAIRDAEASETGVVFDQVANTGNPIVLDPGAGTSTALSVILLSTWKPVSGGTSGSFTMSGGNVVNITTGVDIFASNTLVNQVNQVTQGGVQIATGSGLSAGQDAKLTRVHAVLDVIEGTLDHQEVMRVLLAAVAGKVAGANTTNVTIRDQADGKDRIDATVDEFGNRTAVTVDAT